MALVTTQGFQLDPQIGRGLARGASTLGVFSRLGQQNLALQREQQVREALTGAQAPQMQPQTEQERMLAEQTAGLGGALAESEQAQPVMSQEDMIRTAREIDPGEAQKQLKVMGLDDASRRAEASRTASQIMSVPFEQREAAIMERVNTLRSQGRDPQDTLQLLQMNEQQQNQALTGIQLLDLSTKERLSVAERRGRAAEIPAGQREFESLIAGMTPDEQERARRIKAGLDPRATGSADLTIAQKDLADLVAKSKAKIAEKVKFAEATGSKRAGMIDKVFTRVAEIEQGIGNIDKAIQAIDDGAQSGPLINRFTPTIRAQTKRLEQVRNLMALDVLNSATFGALSEKELEVVQQTAMPDLPPTELREWLQLRKEGMRKLQESIREQAIFLDEGGTQAGFLRKMVKESEPAVQQPEAQPSAPTGGIKFLGFE